MLPKHKRNFLKFEMKALKKGFRKIAGIDEAGRGPLAGPVVAACCMIPEGVVIDGVDDSKLLAPKKRKEVFEALKRHPNIAFGIGIVNADIIDQINILQATVQAMQIAVANLKEKPDFLLVDGNVPLSIVGIPIEKIIKGDQLSQSIAAASIVAKETRDDIMVEYHQKFSNYKFDKHKGYGTAEHLDLLQRFGPSPIHRMSFAPLNPKRVDESQFA